jgi:PiT family inorganic phosphate transporter
VAFVVIALCFDYTNGFHDAANAIAVAVSTRALSPRAALTMSAAMNLLGASISTSVAATVGSGIITSPEGNAGLTLVFAAILGAIAWNLITWRLGLPSSSSHALIGALVGSALVAGSDVKWSGLGKKVVAPMVISPVTGFVLGLLVMVALLWILRRRNPHRVGHLLHRGQILSAAAISLGHGLQDAQKTMGVITLALVVTGHLSHFAVPVWVIVAAAAAMGLGTMSGGWRIMRTLGRRIIKLDNAQGFAAQSMGSVVLFVSSHFGLPVSTTHVTSGSIMGVGATRRVSAVRWGVAGNMVAAWLLTLPAAGAVAALVELILRRALHQS